jgi:cellulose synthase (UDP-forming)
MQTMQKDSPHNALPPTNLNTRLIVFRIVAIITCIVGVNYIIWRYFFSLNHTALWLSIPLILAETYSVIDLLFFSFMMWKPTKRNPLKPFEATLDIYITTYNEPIDLVRLTAQAAKQIEWPNFQVYILDDGARLEAQQMALEVGCEYITRGEEWKGMQRHAKAGNVNNALMQTSGEFILILDADQIPSPKIVQKCIGFFRDSKVAFVQTPQSFYNLPPGDPFGSDAPLFYGPILVGKDGWNAAFFCGSNAILRREALMQLGLRDYVQQVERQVNRSIESTNRHLSKVRKTNAVERDAINSLKQKVLLERQKLKDGQSLEKTSEEIREAFRETHYVFTDQDIESIAGSLKDLAEMGDEEARQVSEYLLEEKSNLIRALKYSPESIGIDQQIIRDLDLTRANEAQPISPLATISITEDMATAMQLHAAGWKSIFYPEILAYGLAPEDLGSALSQRLRWAQGTIQVLKRDNPLIKKGLSIPQRLSYFTTMFSYFSGFINLIFLLCPIVYLFTGIAPVNAYSWDFMLRLIPFLLLNKILFRIVANKIPVFRGEQYNLGLFSLWIQAVISVVIGKKLGFVVTPKQRQSGNYLPLVWPQLVILLLTIVAIVYGILGYFAGLNYQLAGLLINIFWGIYNGVMLSVIVRAAVYKPPIGWQVRPPDFSSAKSESFL